MVVKNIQIYNVQIGRKQICKSKNWKQTLLPPDKTPSPVPIVAPKAGKNYSFPPVKGED